MRFLALFFCIVPALAADLSPQILAAAAAGKSSEVEALLAKGAPLEAHDRSGRTPLMLAAQHGQTDTVRLLLAKGASATARDKTGYTAYGLALLDPTGRGDHTAALQALPQPIHPRVAMDAVVASGGLISSCYMPPGQLKQQVTNLNLDAVTAKEIVDYARASGKALADIVANTADAAAQVTLEVQPGAACEAQSGDSLNLTIDVRVYAAGHKLLREKRFAGGFKGLRKQTVDNAAQYGPVYLSWIKPQAGPMYWFIVETLFQTIL